MGMAVRVLEIQYIRIGVSCTVVSVVLVSFASRVLALESFEVPTVFDTATSIKF